VEREVVGDQPEPLGDLRHLEQVPKLDAVRAGRVLEQERDAGAGFLEVDAVVGAADVDVHVAADRAVEASRAPSGPRAAGVRRGRRAFTYHLDRPGDRRRVLPVRQLVAAPGDQAGGLGREEVVQEPRGSRSEDLRPHLRRPRVHDGGHVGVGVRNRPGNAVADADPDRVVADVEAQGAMPPAGCQPELGVTIARRSELLR
jgi:hypothetical protein